MPNPRTAMTEPCFPLLSLARLRMGIDGQGITTLVAGAGCPLNCRWCINRSLLHNAPAETVTAAELLERVKIDDLYFRSTGGGLTFGGGESLLHAAFIRRVRELCPAEWTINVETSLAVPRENVRVSLGVVDDYIVDCKDINAAIYAHYTGGDERLMEENLKALIEAVGAERIHIRVPLIPQYNTSADQEESVRKLRSLGLSRIETFSYVIR